MFHSISARLCRNLSCVAIYIVCVIHIVRLFPGAARFLELSSTERNGVLPSCLLRDAAESKASLVLFRWRQNNATTQHQLANAYRQRRVFFHETSGHRRLNPRQCCAIESAALHSPSRPVDVFLSSDGVVDDVPTTFTKCFRLLPSYPNVAIILIDNREYFRGTELQEWYVKTFTVNMQMLYSRADRKR